MKIGKNDFRKNDLIPKQTISFSELCLDESRQRDQVEDHVDEEEGHREDEGDPEVEPAVHEQVELLTLISVLLLQVVGTVYVSEN
jgi:hypothetical protein